MYGNSIIGVGIASSLYHSSRGDARKILRFCDYAMIATSTLVLLPYPLILLHNLLVSALERRRSCYILKPKTTAVKYVKAFKQ
jgi:hypothetical protein